MNGLLSKRGDQIRLARRVGISPRHMNDILKRRKRPSPEIAKKLEEETGIDRSAWLWPDEIHNPLIGEKDGNCSQDS
jgi:plasmid maintenance system antidote protein VapI